MISLREIMKMTCLSKQNLDEGCVERLLPPSAAEFCFETHIIFEISLREISKMMCVSKNNLARSAKKNFFTQPPSKEYFAAEGGKISLARHYLTQTILNMKQVIIHLRKIALAALAFFALASLSFAGTPDPSGALFKIGKERKLLLTIPRVAGNAEIRLLAKDGSILFQETVRQGRYSKVFDLSKMEEGEYTAFVAHNGKETVQPFAIQANAIDLDPAQASVVVLPQIKVEGDAVELRMANQQIAKVRVAIVRTDGELVFEDLLPATAQVQRRYNLSRLPKGSYTFAVHTPERALYQDFSR